MNRPAHESLRVWSSSRLPLAAAAAGVPLAGLAAWVRLAGLAAWISVAGCKGDVIDIPVELTVDDASCALPDPSDSWLPCGGQVGVWLLSGDGTPLDEACVPFAAEPQSVDALSGLLEEVSFAGLGEGDRVAIEIAVYSETDVDSCVRFDPEGMENVFPAYWGRSEYVTLSRSSEPLIVDLTCFAPIFEPCIENWIQVSATVTDLETWEPIQGEPSLLSVTAGTVTQEGTYLLGSELEGQGPEWTGEIPTIPDPDQCVGVVATAQDGIYPFLSCDSEMVDIDFVVANGYVAGATLVENILAATGPEDPSDMGLGLGRVVNMNNLPVSGAQILPEEPGLTVRYLSEDMTSLDGPATATHGYFVVQGESPGCCYTFFQVEPQLDVEIRPFGLVPGHLTVIPVRVAP